VELKRVWVAGRGCRECDGDGLIGLRAAKKAKLLELKSTREEYIYIANILRKKRIGDLRSSRVEQIVIKTCQKPEKGAVTMQERDQELIRSIGGHSRHLR
jgi:hypothetical protein